ncbi:MAG: hypothetical protein AAB681_03100 [Patescibacteria group bacterium]
MKNKSSIVLGIVVAFILIPQIALASWWNPFSWFKKNDKPIAEQTVKVEQGNTQEKDKPKLVDQKVPEKKTPAQKINNAKEKSPKGVSASQVVSPSVITPTPPDLCKNVEGVQSSYIPKGMYRETDGNCYQKPIEIYSPEPQIVQNTTVAQTKPVIKEFEILPAKGRIGQNVKVSWKVDSATTCAFTNTSDLQVPFVGSLPNTTRDITLDQYSFKDNKFTFYLTCADKDWNTTQKSITIPYDAVFASVQPTSFFSASGGNIGNGGIGYYNGTPTIVISPLKEGASAVVEIDGYSYPLSENGIHFPMTHLKFDPTWVYAGSCTSHTYKIKFSYTDSYNSLITGESTIGSFCLNNLKSPTE